VLLAGIAFGAASSGLDAVRSALRTSESTDSSRRPAPGRAPGYTTEAPTRRTLGERAVSEVVGAILVFALLVLVLSIFQALGVPAANKEVEFDHNQELHTDMQDLDSALSRTAGLGAEQSVQMAIGVQYPNRFVFFNPPTPTGTIQTLPAANGNDVVISNAAANGEAGDYWEGGGDSESFTTKRVFYNPSYNVYTSAPNTTLTTGVLYNHFSDTRVILDSDNVIDGRTISLVTIDGELTRNSLSTTVTTRPLSAPTNRIAITDTGTPITITLPTRLKQEDWDRILADEIGPGPNQYVSSVTVDDAADTVTITLEAGNTYNLRLAKIGVGQGGTEPGSHYLTDQTGDNMSLSEGSRTTVTFQVRDRFNNPVSGETVWVGVPNNKGQILDNGVPHSGYSDTVQYTTDEDGEIQVTYQAKSVIGSNEDVQMRASFIDSDVGSGSWAQSDLEDADLTLRTLNTSTADTATDPLFNPFDGVILFGARTSLDNCGLGTGKTCHVDLTFKNLNPWDVNIVEMRYVFYGGDSQGNAPSNTGEAAHISYLDDGTGSPQTEDVTLEYSKEYEPIAPTTICQNGGTAVVKIGFYNSTTIEDDEAKQVQSAHWFAIDVLLDDGNETYRRTYLVDPDTSSISDSSANCDPGNNPPSIGINDVVDNSGAGDASFNVDWSASDPDNDLDSVTVELISGGSTVDSETIPVSGGAASGDTTLSQTGGEGSVYTIRVTVSDDQGLQDSAEEDHEADGNPGGNPP